MAHGVGNAQSTTQTPTLLTALSLEGKSAAAAGKDAQTWDPAAAAFGSLNLNPKNWSQGQIDAVLMGQGLQKERNNLESVHAKYSADLRGAEFTGRFVDGATVVAAIGAPLVAGVTVVGVAGLKVVSDYNIAYKRAAFDEKVGQAKAVYDAKIDDMARLVIGRATLNPLPGETPQQAALRYADEFMDTPQFKAMDKNGQDAVRFQLQDRLNRLQAKGEKVSKTALDALEAKRANLQSDVAATQADLTQLETQISSQLTASSKVLAATQAGLDNLEARLKAGVGKLEADVGQLQYMSWMQLPPKQKLELLDNPGFLPQMPDRAKIQSDLKVTVFTQTTVSYATAVGDVAGILNDIGLPLNMASVNQGVSLAINGVSAYASFATGDYFGGIASLGKFVGGLRGKPDPAAQQQMAIMKQLRQVLELQQQTLKKIDELSKQLNVSTERILRAVTDTFEVASLAAKAADSLNFGNALTACRRFYDEAGSANRLTSEGIFRTYDDRATHFETHASEFAECERLFKGTGNLKKSEVDDTSHLPMPLWGYTIKTGAAANTVSPWQYQTLWYEPMLALNRYTFKLELGNEACARRLVGMLSAAPATLREAYAMLSPCTTEAVRPDEQGRPPGLFSRAINQTVTFEGALQNVAHPGRAAEIARLMLFAQPFQELRRQSNKAKLYTSSQLTNAGVPDNVRNTQVAAYANMAEVLGVAIAQQTLLSGAMSARWAADVLRSGNYGFAYSDGVSRQQPWRNAVAPLTSSAVAPLWTYVPGQSAMSAPQEFVNAAQPSAAQLKTLQDLRKSYADAYLSAVSAYADKDGFCPAATELASQDVARQAAVVVCLMDAHPAFARNVSLILFSDAVRAGGRDLSLVDRWLREDSSLVLSAAMPGLALVRTGPAGQPQAWGVRLLHPDGRELFLQSPAVAEMEKAYLSYPSVAYPLMQLRENLLDRAAALSNPALLPKRGDNSERARVMRSTWVRQQAQVRAPAEAGVAAVAAQ